MASAALAEHSEAPNSFPFGGGAQSHARTMKRKTPSELRGEQLKRKNGELPRTQKYIDIRVSDVYPVKKSSERCRMILEKERTKDSLAQGQILNEVINPSAACGFSGKGKSSFSGDRTDKLNNSECSNPFAKDIADQVSLKNEKYDQHNVAELHLGKKLSDYAKIDMEKTLKGLVHLHVPASSTSSADSSGKPSDLPSLSGNLHSEFSIAGHRPPLDFSLKTTLRLVSSSSVKWCHRLSANLAPINLNQFTSLLCCDKDQDFGYNSSLNTTTETLYSKALHSWMYPQTSLPSSIISALSLSSSRAEMEFLRRRQQDWENSFQNLYYLLRKNLCSIFYVYTSQFVVLFVGGNFLRKKKRSCNVYLSQSTRGLRSLLKKHDISFSMPLCCCEVEQATDDDLVELSEIKKRNLGETLHLDSLSDVDNSPESLLAFIGNENVHNLYDFLLNYRCFLNTFTNVDVPLLYAPVPFQNASVCVPEVRCKEMKRADTIALSPRGSGSETEHLEGGVGLSSSSVCYSIEIKDTFLPPWVISGICVAMGSEGRTFEASFTTDPSSVSLNVALDSASQKSDLPTDLNKSFPESADAFGIDEAVIDPRLRSASLRHLTYSNDGYFVRVDPI